MAHPTTSLHLDARPSHQALRPTARDSVPPAEKEPSVVQRPHHNRPISLQVQDRTKDAKTTHDAKRIQATSQEPKDKTKVSVVGSGEEKVAVAHRGRQPPVSGVVKANGDPSKLPTSVSHSTRPSPQVLVLHKSAGEPTAKHPGSHDLKGNQSSSGSHHLKGNHFSSGSHDLKGNQSSSGSHDLKGNHFSSGSHDPKANQALKPAGSGPVATSVVQRHKSQSSYEEDDVDVSHNKGTVRYIEDLNSVHEVTIVNMGRSGFTQDTPDFLSIGAGEETTVQYAGKVTEKADTSQSKEAKKDKKPSKSTSPSKERTVAEAWGPPDPGGGVAESPVDLLSPTSSLGAPSPKSPSEVKLRREVRKPSQDQTPRSVEDLHTTAPTSDHDPANKDTLHADSSTDQKSKSIFKRFSDSFMRVRSKSQNQNQKSLETTSWYYADGNLPSTVSEQRLDNLTENERQAVVEDLEVIPRAQSLQHLGGPVLKTNETAVFGGDQKGHVQISVTQVKVPSHTPGSPDTSPSQEDDSDLRSSSAPALLRFAKDRKVVRRQSSSSQMSLTEQATSPTEPCIEQRLSTSLEHKGGAVGDQGTLEGKTPSTEGNKSEDEQKPKKKGFLTAFLHKGKKSTPSVQTIEENAAPDPNTLSPVAAKKSPVPTKKSPVAVKKSPVPAKMSPVAAKMSPVAAKMSPGAAKKSPVAAKKSPVPPTAANGSPVAAKKSPVPSTAANGSPVAAKKTLHSPVAARNPPVVKQSFGAKGSPIADKKSPTSPAKNSPVAAKKSLGSPLAARNSPTAAKKSPTASAKTRSSIGISKLSVESQQSPKLKRASAPNPAAKKTSSSSSSIVTQLSSNINSDPFTSPTSSFQSPVLSSPMNRKRKVGLAGPTSPVTPPSTPSKPTIPLNISITQHVPKPVGHSNMNQPVDLDALLRQADAKLSAIESSSVGIGTGYTALANNLTLSPPISPLPPAMAGQFSGTSSNHSRQSSGEGLIDLDDIPSPTGEADLTPEHHAAAHLPPSKSSKSAMHAALATEKGVASVGGAHLTTHFDFSDDKTARSEKHSAFTAALPPRPPSKRWNSVVSASQPTAGSYQLSQSDTSTLSTMNKKKTTTSQETKHLQKSTLTRSSKGRSSVAARASVKKKLSSKDLAGAQPIPKSSISRVKSPDLPLTTDGVKTSEGTMKHTSDSAAVTMKHTAGGSGTLKRSSDTGTLRRGSTATRSVRSSMGARPSSGTAAGKKSAGSKDPLSPSHMSIKKVSSGDRLIQKDSTMRQSKSHSSMRAPSNKTGTLQRGQHSGGVSLTQGDTLQRHKTSQSTLRKSVRKINDDIAVFNEISAEASVLKSSDHRRMVRPVRQKPSAGHLKMLHNRQNVSSEFNTATPDAPIKTDSPALDPNLYSTYMSKKKMDAAALNGLAIKLDFTTVKLKKTGIVDRLTEQVGGGGEVLGEAEASTTSGEEMNTKHSVLLLMVKGRRFVQTYLVEPSGASLNSGDVFLCISGKHLYHWVGKSANVIEKARGADIVSRVLNKKELNCQANRICTIEEGVDIPDREAEFWSLLGGKQGVKSSESTHSDEVYERGVIAATRVYELQGEGDDIQFVSCHSNSQQMLKHSILDTKKIFLLDFVSEVYVWIGRQSPVKLRKKALELGKAHFDTDCKPAVFQHVPTRTSGARASGRLRKNSVGRQSKHNLNASMRKTSKDAKPIARPSWALFARVVEGGESILLREKFSDWPEQGRIIKMKGHEASVKLMVPSPLAELKPADVEKMMKPTAPFEGLRLEGDNIHRGKGNYMVSRSSFACNRVRTLSVTKWVIKEYENVLVPEDKSGLFFSAEGYVIRWAYRITVVKELEGLTPGAGQFAQDKKYQKSLQAQSAKVEDSAKPKTSGDGSDSESEDNNNEECRKLLESGGRDRCAYFFWQGNDCTVNEKGAAALMTVELDKEKGPQIRVVQGKEPPAFLTLFRGRMVVLRGRSDNNSVETSNSSVKMYSVRGQEKDEAFLLELDGTSQPLSSQLRSRGCYIIHNVKSAQLFLWIGSKSVAVLQKVAQRAIKHLKNRIPKGDIVTVQEGHESNNFWAAIGDRHCYMSLVNDPQPYDFTPRLFELTSTTGEFTATEVICTGRNNCTDAFPFLQEDIYGVVQPAMFLLDVFNEVYVWIGWWPVIENELLKEANATTGSAHSRWLQDKRLALETGLLYSKACGRPKVPHVYLVHAGTEHQSFVNNFPFWIVNAKVQELNCKDRKPIPQRTEAEEELKKYSRTKFTLEELKKRPLPEGVDPAKLEVYLCDEEFDKVFKMSREEFGQQPIWKKTTLKKQAGLF